MQRVMSLHFVLWSNRSIVQYNLLWMKGGLVVQNAKQCRMMSGDQACQTTEHSSPRIPLSSYSSSPLLQNPLCPQPLNHPYRLRRHGHDLSSNSFLVAKTSWLCFLFTLIPRPCHLWAHFSNVVDDMTGQNQCGKTGWFWHFWVVCPFKCVQFERPWLHWSGWFDWEGLSNRGQSKMAQSVRARVMHCHTPDTSLTPWLYWCIRTDLSYTKFSRKLDLMWKNNQNPRCY